MTASSARRIDLEERLLTTREAATALGVSPARLGQLVRAGRLASLRVEGRLMFRADSVQEYLTESGRDSATSAEGAQDAWESDLAALSSWLGDVGEAVAPFEGLAPLPQVLPAAEEVPLDVEEEEPEPPAAVPQPVLEPEPPAAVPQPALEPEPPPAPDPAPVPATEPEPVLEAPAAPVAQAPEPQPEPELRPEPAVVAPMQAAPEAAGRPSRQALLAVQPIQRFAILKDVGEALKKVPGVTGVRLERLDSGVASYRVTFAVEMPPDEALAGAVAVLGLALFVVGA